MSTADKREQKNAAPQGSVEIGGGTSSATPEAPAAAAPPDKKNIVDLRLYDEQGVRRIAVRYGDDQEEDRPATAAESHLERELAEKTEMLKLALDNIDEALDYAETAVADLPNAASESGRAGSSATRTPECSGAAPSPSSIAQTPIAWRWRWNHHGGWFHTGAEPQRGDAITIEPLYAQSATGAIAEVAAERQRQVESEGWTHKHDDGHGPATMAVAGACYVLIYASKTSEEALSWRDDYAAAAAHLWPWDIKLWKPKNPRRDLIRAAALMVAEIERMDRNAPTDGGRKV